MAIKYDRAYVDGQLVPHLQQILAFLERDKSVLDIGCSTGYLAQIMAEDFGCMVSGIERNEAAAEKARSFCERVYVGSAEDDRLWDQVNEQFDVVVMGSVLEHLSSPQELLKRVAGILRPDGYIIISIPNISHWTIIRDLLQGRFDYQEYGLLDRTHLHFFTISSLHEMLRENGFNVLAQEMIVDKMPFDKILWKFPFRKLRFWLAHAVPHLFGYEFVVKANRVR